MTQYIDKNALVAEIERRIQFFIDCRIDNYETNAGEICGLKRLLKFLDTIETKEVDLDDDVDKILEANDWNFDKIDFYHFAKHFYELGLEAQKEDSLWISVEEQPLPYGIDVLAYNREWLNEWTPNGIRIGYLSEEGFVSAKYSSCDEDYITCREDGDDYDTWQKQSDGSIKTWYNNDGDIKEGYRPNMPTHYMMIPNCKARKGE